jgi:hypothetical protein
MHKAYNYQHAARFLRHHRQFQYGRIPRGRYSAAYRMFTGYTAHSYTLYSYDENAPLYVALFREPWHFAHCTPRAVFYNTARYSQTTGRQQKMVHNHVNALRAETTISTVYITDGATLNAIRAIIRRTNDDTNMEELVTNLVCVAQIARVRRDTYNAASADTKKAFRMSARQPTDAYDPNLRAILPGNTMYNPEINGVYVH